MSTRIYRGFVIDTTDFREILARVDAFRPWVQAQAEAKLDAFVSRVEQGEPGRGHELWQNRRVVARDGGGDPAVDTDFTLSFIPCEGKTLGVAHVASNAWFAAWLEQPGVSYYGYWNNADSPDDVSEEEWARREADWQVLTAGPVSTQMFGIEVMSPHGPLPKAWRSSSEPRKA